MPSSIATTTTGAAAAPPTTTFSFFSAATATATQPGAPPATTTSSSGGGGGGGGEGAPEGEALAKGEEESASDEAHAATRTGSAAGALAPGESITQEVFSKLKRYDRVGKAWKDLDVGTFCVVTGGGKGKSRWAFSPPATTTPVCQGWLDGGAKVEVAPSKAPGGKPGGLSLTCKAFVGGAVELHMFLISFRTPGDQSATLEAIKKAQEL